MKEFVEYLEELFEEFKPIKTRMMFGRHGIYHNNIMFGLVVGDTIYLKADETTARYFVSKGLGQFEYMKGDIRVKMSYYLAPKEILEDRETASLWARRAYEAALRSKHLEKEKHGKEST